MNNTQNIKSTSKQSGIALVLVLWMLSLLVILAMGYSRMMRTESVLTANLVSTAQANALAEAGVSIAISELLNSSKLNPLKTDGTNYSKFHNQHKIDFKVRAESGKIDINTAQPEILQGLLESASTPEEDILPILHAILDWRDKDNLKRAYGAEDADYEKDGYQYGTKDGDFNSIDELLLIKGVTLNVYNAIKGTLTVHSHLQGIYPLAASRGSLLALPNISEIEVDNYLEERKTSTVTDTFNSFPGVDPIFFSNTKGNVYTIISQAKINNTRSGVKVVILLGQKNKSPFSILSWRELQLAFSKLSDQDLSAG